MTKGILGVYAKNLLDLTFSLTYESISFIVSSAPESLTPISFTYWLCLHLQFLFIYTFSTFRIPSVRVFCLYLNFQVLDCFFHLSGCFITVFLTFLKDLLISSSFFVLFFLHLFKGTFHFLFKGLHHFQKVIFKVIFFCFISVLGYSDLVVVETLISDNVMQLFMLLNIFLRCCQPIFSSNLYKWVLQLQVQFRPVAPSVAVPSCVGQLVGPAAGDS